MVQERWLHGCYGAPAQLLILFFVQKATTRQVILSKRAQTSQLARLIAAKRLIRLLIRLPSFNTAKKIASYLSFSDEISTKQLNQRLIADKNHIYVPIIDQPKKNQMSFQSYSLDKKMRKNRFGIQEPYACRRGQVAIAQLEIIFMPLVAFDKHGNRIGMGGGFYDRSLALFANKTRFQKPLLIGIAYHFQQISNISAEEFDIPLDYVLTNKGLIRCHPRSSSICPN